MAGVVANAAAVQSRMEPGQRVHTFMDALNGHAHETTNDIVKSLLLHLVIFSAARIFLRHSAEHVYGV